MSQVVCKMTYCHRQLKAKSVFLIFLLLGSEVAGFHTRILGSGRSSSFSVQHQQQQWVKMTATARAVHRSTRSPHSGLRQQTRHQPRGEIVRAASKYAVPDVSVSYKIACWMLKMRSATTYVAHATLNSALVLAWAAGRVMGWPAAGNNYTDFHKAIPFQVKSVEDVAREKYRPLMSRSSFRGALLVAFFMVTGICLGAGFGWSLIDSIYFTATTLMTVGYGDLNFGAGPANIQLVGAAFVTLGFFVFWGALSNIFNAALERESKAVERYVVKVTQKAGESDDAQDAADRLGHARSVYREAKRRLRNNLGFALCKLTALVLGSTFIVAHLERWDWRTAIYWSCVTLSSVGYGDVTPLTNAGKLCATVLMLSGVLIFTNCVGFLASYSASMREIQARESVMTQFGETLTASELNTLARGDEIR